MLTAAEHNNTRPKGRPDMSFYNSLLWKRIQDERGSLALEPEDNKESRDSLQAAAVECLLTYKRLLLQWGTGVGKSRVAVQSIQSLVLMGKKRILLLVAETDHKRNWKKEFIDHYGEEWGDYLFSCLVVECYQSLKNYRDTEWDLIVADEAHHLRSDKRVYDFCTLSAEFILCVSATISDKGDAEKLLSNLRVTFGEFQEMNFSVQQGIDNGFIGKPEIYIHLLSISSVRVMQSISVRWGAPYHRKEVECSMEVLKKMREDKKRWPSVEATVICRADEAYDYLCDEISEKQEEIRQLRNDLDQKPEEEKRISKKIKYTETEIKQLGSQRKLLLGRCKTLYARALLKRLREQRYICFCTDVEQAEALGAESAISSSRSQKANASVIASFNDGKTDSLFAVGMVQEGTNLTGIQVGVIIQLGGKERNFIQRFGRAIRAENPIQHLIVMDNTKDVDYCNTALEKIRTDYIKIINP